jgi:NTE family protein
MTNDLFVSGESPLARLTSSAEPLELPGGEVLFEQGAPADSMYLLLNGRLRVFAESEQGRVLVGEVVPGETVGEMALLAGGTRSATVVAARDCRLVRISPDSLLAATRSEPEALLELTRELVARLQRSDRRRERRAAPATVALMADSEAIDLTVFTRSFAGTLASHGPVALVTAADATDRSEPELAEWFDRLEAAHRFLVYDSAGPEGWRAHCARQADLVLHLVAAGEPSFQRLPDPTGGRRELVVLSSDGAGGEAKLDPAGFDACHHVDPRVPEHLQRLARFVAGEAIGLVLGGGGARGFAHIGVLRALRELKIPIDAVGGASIGSILGALVAMDLDADAIAELSRRWIVGADLLGERQLPLVSAVNPRRALAGRALRRPPH